MDGPELKFLIIRDWQNEDTLWQHCCRDHVFPNVDSFCHMHNICGGHKFCVLDTTTECFWKSSETFLVSVGRATMLPRFSMDGEHHRTQCWHHNVSSFCRGLMYSGCDEKDIFSFSLGQALAIRSLAWISFSMCHFSLTVNNKSKSSSNKL